MPDLTMASSKRGSRFKHLLKELQEDPVVGGLVRDLSAGPAAAAELFGTLLTGTVAGPRANLAADVDMLRGETPGRAVANLPAYEQAFTYAPQTAGGQELVGRVGEAFDRVLGPLTRAASSGADWALEQGSRVPGGDSAVPLMLAGVKTILDTESPTGKVKAPKVPKAPRPRAWRMPDGSVIPAAKSAERAGWDTQYLARQQEFFDIADPTVHPVKLADITTTHTLPPGYEKMDVYKGMAAAGELPPVVLFRDSKNGKLFVLDGNGRISAAQAAGVDEVPARFTRGSEPARPTLDPVTEMLERAKRDGGFTFDPGPRKRFLESGKDEGYPVGMYPQLSKTLAPADATPEALARFLQENQATLAENPANMVGGWRSPEGNLVLDVTRVPSSLDEASSLGRARGERAIWDLKNGKEVELDYGDFLTPEQAASWRPGEKQPPLKDASARFKAMGLEGAEQAAAGGMHLRKNAAGQYTGADPAIRGPKQLDAVRERRLAQTERGAPYAGWYIDEGGLPADPKTGFEGGALWKTNPEAPSTATYAAHSPQASPGTNLAREVAVEHGARMPGWDFQRILEAVQNDTVLPKDVRPLYTQQVEKHAKLRLGQPVELGPKEGAFAGNLMDEDALSTVDRHELRTLDKKAVGAGDELELEGSGRGDSQHAFAHGENLVLNQRMRALAAKDPDYLARIGWPRYPDGSFYPLDPRGGQAARWLEQKANTDYPKLYAENPQAAREAVLADPMNRVSDTAPLMTATENIAPGFDWRTPTGHDALYLQPGVRQWPGKTADAPTRAHPLVVPYTEEGRLAASGRTMAEAPAVAPASKRFVDNRAATRLLAEGEPATTWTFNKQTYPVELPISHAGEGTGVKALLERLSEQEVNELGPQAFEPLTRADAPAPKSDAEALTRSLLTTGGLPGLEKRVKKHGYKGLLGLLPLAYTAGASSEE